MTDVRVNADAETELRAFIAGVLRRHVPAEAGLDALLGELKKHVAWLEAAWFDCHARHSRHETVCEEQRPGDDAVVIVHGLVGEATTFTGPADYQNALDLAVRAYVEGMGRALLS